VCVSSYHQVERFEAHPAYTEEGNVGTRGTMKTYPPLTHAIRAALTTHTFSCIVRAFKGTRKPSMGSFSAGLRAEAASSSSASPPPSAASASSADPPSDDQFGTCI